MTASIDGTVRLWDVESCMKVPPTLLPLPFLPSRWFPSPSSPPFPLVSLSPLPSPSPPCPLSLFVLPSRASLLAGTAAVYAPFAGCSAALSSPLSTGSPALLGVFSALLRGSSAVSWARMPC
eukprot:658958-Rhodomonas_salina.1